LGRSPQYIELVELYYLWVRQHPGSGRGHGGGVVVVVVIVVVAIAVVAASK